MSYDRPAVAWLTVGGYTVRWRRGERAAYVFRGGGCPDGDAAAIDTIPVDGSGWTDFAEVRRVAHAWHEHYRPPQPRRGGPAPARTARAG